MSKKKPIAKKSAKKPVAKYFGEFSDLTPAQIFEKFKSQKLSAKIEKLYGAAKSAKNRYRARKKDFGKLVFIGVKGQPDPQKKGRKGFLLYVTKTGKKRLVRDSRNGIIPRTLREIEVPFKKNLINSAKEFIQKHRKKLKSGKVAIKKSGTSNSTNQNDFSDKMVSEMAQGLKKTIEAQSGNRNFIFSAKVLVKLPDGKMQVFSVGVPIAKPDHITIKLGGMENFIRKKFYAFMARELARVGLVTSGSANHVRRLEANDGEESGGLVNSIGEHWEGNELDICRIQKIDWQIEQA